MLHPYLLPYLKFHTRISNFLASLPYRYNEKSGLFETIKSIRTLRTFQIQCWISLALVILQLANCASSSYTFVEKLVGLCFWFITLLNFLLRWNVTLDNGNMQLLNTFLVYERNLIRGKQSCVINSCLDGINVVGISFTNILID